jgi:sugar phosphate isomerase/epimerase
MKLAAFTDEINPDPTRAVQLAAAWNIPCVEVRSLPGGRFPLVADTELEEFHKIVTDAGLIVSGVSPGFCKCPVHDPSVPQTLAEGLPRACEWAQRWDTDLVSCFGFARDDSPSVPAAVIDRMAQMAEITAQNDCRLVLENEAVCWGATGLEATEIIRQIDSDHFTLLWDPGNSARAGSTCPYPDEYEQLKDLVTHVHLKNFDPATGQWSLMEKGIVDWPAQFAALKRDQYDGFVVIETHLRISPDEFAVIDDNLDALEANSRRNLEYLRTLVDL